MLQRLFHNQFRQEENHLTLMEEVVLEEAAPVEVALAVVAKEAVKENPSTN